MSAAQSKERAPARDYATASALPADPVTPARSAEAARRRHAEGHQLCLVFANARCITLALNMVGNTAPFDVSGHPAMSVPCGTADGLPIGMMLVGRRYDEQTVLRAAGALEKASGQIPAARRGK